MARWPLLSCAVLAAARGGRGGGRGAFGAQKKGQVQSAGTGHVVV